MPLPRTPKRVGDIRKELADIEEALKGLQEPSKVDGKTLGDLTPAKYDWETTTKWRPHTRSEAAWGTFGDLAPFKAKYGPEGIKDYDIPTRKETLIPGTPAQYETVYNTSKAWRKHEMQGIEGEGDLKPFKVAYGFQGTKNYDINKLNPGFRYKGSKSPTQAEISNLGVPWEELAGGQGGYYQGKAMIGKGMIEEEYDNTTSTQKLISPAIPAKRGPMEITGELNPGFRFKSGKPPTQAETRNLVAWQELAGSQPGYYIGSAMISKGMIEEGYDDKDWVLKDPDAALRNQLKPAEESRVKKLSETYKKRGDLREEGAKWGLTWGRGGGRASGSASRPGHRSFKMS